MHITPELNHINLTTHDMGRLTRFYRDVLGFREGFRPPFPVEGVWLYLGDHALIHLVKSNQPVRNDDPAVKHFAFSGQGLAEFLAHLRSMGVSYNVRIAPEIELRQVEVHDPDGNMLEVLFAGSEAEGVNTEPYKWTHPR